MREEAGSHAASCSWALATKRAKRHDEQHQLSNFFDAHITHF